MIILYARSQRDCEGKSNRCSFNSLRSMKTTLFIDIFYFKSKAERIYPINDQNQVISNL